ncbi:putative callose synthase 10-like [Capsicum annuum]|uniref:C3H1-type domain-containing protein n=1 Tax=Capsicum annuum TaxID=4072 RepID=A0A1U8HAT1_CAPAN|nr:zinc finger CCCH domain-containing protein 67 [Capsicum annuum]KAF3633060.1 putative callose synthase 10-like [Capsicum annuum]KAF3647478.1 putative callose synthase 10-like [Capsicum annuum]PHT79727.1 hypothetical protein T459_17779 [Capsicum annuum]
MEGIESQVYMQHQPTTLDKHYLGFHHPQPPDGTSSFSSEQDLRSPEENEVDDELLLQIIVEEVRDLVLNQAVSEEKSKSEAVAAKSVNQDEIAVQIINEEVRNLVLNQAVSEESNKAKPVNEEELAVQIINEELRKLVLNQSFSEERAREGDINESVKEVSENVKGGEVVSKEWGADQYEDDEHSWRENVNVVDVGNEEGGEAGSKEWGVDDQYEDGDCSCREHENVVGVEDEKGSEAGSKKWGVDHYEDGDYSWSEDANVIDVENEAGLKEWGFNCYEDGDHSWRRNENVVDVENEKDGEAGSKLWGYNANGRGLIYPLRPDAEDCAYYMKTGACKYGVNCKFNHPSPRRNQWSMEKGKKKEESEERVGQIECKYYLTEGGCKYGNACKYNHSRRKDAISPVLDYNFLGLPIRPGEKDCPYYMRTGSCKYGSNCRFHHPDPTTAAGNNRSFGYNNSGSAPVQSASYSPVSSWSSPRALNETSPFLPVVYTTSKGIPPPGPQWNSFLTTVCPTLEKSLPTPPAFTMDDPATKTNFYPRPQQPWLVEEYYPERPGQPDCSYFIKTGDCKYKANCKFHHPKTQNFKTNLSILSNKGLPLRPGQPVCSFYSRYGICKFGPGCKFDHPENNDNVASPPAFGFYQPPFGNSATTDGSRMARKGNGNGSLVHQSF